MAALISDGFERNFFYDECFWTIHSFCKIVIVMVTYKQNYIHGSPLYGK